ncbi:hypothetical protein Sango_1891600 [Sesamum angolense]|uniref:Uncharacterized protein n=1 Tax=Sesamum angolense TaxID=2727404 RepID=A0AAE1WIN9_9LAMI|nr:hypothetical protein Sango_1891600 [Sesamum angolense]
MATCFVVLTIDIERSFNVTTKCPRTERLNRGVGLRIGLAAMKPSPEGDVGRLCSISGVVGKSRVYEDCILDMASGGCVVRHGHHKSNPVHSEYVAMMVDSKKGSVPYQKPIRQSSKRGLLHMRHGVKLSKNQSPKTDEEIKKISDIPYASAVGSISYVAEYTRPDVGNALCVTSRYQASAGDQH